MNDPVSYGFVGGYYYKDNSTQYVGYGTFSGYCTVENPCPGGIQLTPTPGAYVTCANIPSVDSKSAYYLLNHPNLNWVRSNASNTIARNIPGGITITGNTYTFYFGRILYNGLYRLGKVHAVNGKMFLEVAGTENTYTCYDVLTCG